MTPSSSQNVLIIKYTCEIAIFFLDAEDAEGFPEHKVADKVLTQHQDRSQQKQAVCGMAVWF